MNKRRNIYRGMNRKRNNLVKGFTVGLVIIGIVGGATFIKLPKFNLLDKVSNFSIFNKEKTSVKEFSYNDVKDKINKSEENKKETVAENAKVATVDNLDIYSIQIAAIDNDEELKKIEQKLDELKIPFSIIDVDNVKKVQTYSSFEEGESRKNLESIKTNFSDAFVSKLEVPLLGLQYTDKYSYVEEICNELNNLISNFKEESKIWDKGEKSLNKEEYKNIINARLDIVGNLEKSSKKINYEGMVGFKENIIKYTTSVKEKSKASLKSIENDEYYIGESLFISSIQGYYSFIKSIKTI
ncbi:hypothetical protein [Paraclostridium sordellii]|uniref:hypothetical protein n=1 Tax=Paraclostridium sordellii TaxID=1505 RepID=UPI0005E65F44|nr:hypothetical protein [Paeniclostridium sordellii]MCQ4697653.1 hypothetical protein [Paeniclostridium sordellii]MDU4412171.1 hypothetical protein [Paeniclostridium sordellii]MDU6112808.1 hypothetical protein [Paeniclostridium sordellii]MDU6480915.1 hypothetical protein [Paeniclostridium sordellii]MRZ27898.1 hypothetical protein [Paeniclostridium sordellii]